MALPLPKAEVCEERKRLALTLWAGWGFEKRRRAINAYLDIYGFDGMYSTLEPPPYLFILMADHMFRLEKES